MNSHVPSYHGYRFPPEIISHAVWLYHRFGVSYRDVEDRLAQRGVPLASNGPSIKVARCRPDGPRPSRRGRTPRPWMGRRAPAWAV